MRILVAEDDLPVANYLKKGLEAELYEVDLAGDGAVARRMAETCDYDLVVLDVNLPTMDGFEVLQNIRAKKPDLAVLMLTGDNLIPQRIRGLDLGADDYLTKPFAFSELAARIRALLRRRIRPMESILRVEDLTLDRLQHLVHRGERRIDLTPKEFALLDYLMRNAGRRVTRAMIIENVWDMSFDTLTNVVDVYINYLRKKIDATSEQKLIRTIRGVGYQVGGEEAQAAQL